MYICKAQVEFNEVLEGRIPTGSGFSLTMRLNGSAEECSVRLHDLPNQTATHTWYKVEIEVVDFLPTHSESLIKGQWFKLIEDDSVVGLGTIQRKVKEIV